MPEILYRMLSYQIIGAAMEVHSTLGPGFLESVYAAALAHELALGGLPHMKEERLTVHYKDQTIGDYRADFVVDKKVILELKAVSKLVSVHESQAHHYLTATGLRLAILINFGAESLQYRRVVR